MTTILGLIQLLGISGALSKYVYVEEEKDWSGAYSSCRTDYTDLAPVNDQSDMDLLRELAGTYTGFIWFGLLRNMTDKTKWWFSGGGEVTTFFWDGGQPNAFMNENYGIMINYRWHDAPGNMLLHFFCYSVQVVREEKTWDEALEFCRMYHKDLASISSKTEMMLIQRELQEDVSTQLVWMGLHFLAGQWLWLDGSTAGFEAWAQGDKPECPGVDLSCGALVSDGGVWKAHDCQEKLHFICY